MTRKRSLTEQAILNSGFGQSHGNPAARDLHEIAERCEISVHALLPHLRSLVERGEVVELPGSGLYQRCVALKRVIDGDLRERAAALLAQGRTTHEAADELGISISTIYGWRAKGLVA